MKTKYNIGDEVFWNDPGNGLCSGYNIVIDILDNGIYIIESKNGSLTECYESELS